MKPLLPVALSFLFLIVSAASAQTYEPRRNVKIEVQIQSAGYTAQNVDPSQSAHQSSQTQILVVMDGLEGRLFIGNQVPYTTWYRDYLQREGYLTEAVVFRNVGASLVVRPRVVGDQIEVTLTPEISYETQDGRGTIAVTKLSTVVIVPNGETLDIGGSLQKSEFENNFYRRETGEAVQILLTPRIME